LSEVAQELLSDHAHRPGLVQEDLAKATEALHADGTLSNLSIVGLDGKDLIARDEQGQTLLLDANNPQNQKVLSSELTTQAIGDNGRTADLAADGSGKYTVVSGDSCWRVANDILTAQGVADPTDNQIANYIKELETTNGRSFAQLQVGDEILIPTQIQGGENSQFAAPAVPETADSSVPADSTVPTDSVVPADATVPTDSSVPADATVPADSTDSTVPTDATVPALSAEAAKQMELEKFGIDTSYALMAKGFDRAVEHFTPRGTYSKPSATLNDITNTLNRSDLTADEKLGLGMMQSQFDYLKSSEDGNIHLADLERGKTQRYEEIDAKYSQMTETLPQPEAVDTTVVTDPAGLAEAQNSIDSNFEQIGSAYLKAVEHESPEGSYSSAFINHDDVVAALSRTDLTADERAGMEMLDQNFDLLKNPESGTISHSDLLERREAMMKTALERFSQAPQPVIEETPEVVVEQPVVEQPAVEQTLDPNTNYLPDYVFPPMFDTSSIYQDEDMMAA
jgi:hypothetical protein